MGRRMCRLEVTKGKRCTHRCGVLYFVLFSGVGHGGGV